MGEPPPPKPGEPPPVHHHSHVHPAVTPREGDGQGATKHMRSFAQILADEAENRNILEIKLIKKSSGDSTIPRPENLSLEKVGELMFDVLKIKAEDCIRVALITNRYDTKEVMLKPGVDPTPYLTTEPLTFHEHEVIVRRLTKQYK